MGEAKEIFINLDIETVARLESAMAVRAKVWAEAARAVYDQAKADARARYKKARAVADAVSYKADSAALAIYNKAETKARIIYNKAEKNKGR